MRAFSTDWLHRFPESNFEKASNFRGAAPGVEPRFVGQFRFSEWTKSRQMVASLWLLAEQTHYLPACSGQRSGQKVFCEIRRTPDSVRSSLDYSGIFGGVAEPWV